jgi:hypothetical protein
VHECPGWEATYRASPPTIDHHATSLGPRCAISMQQYELPNVPISPDGAKDSTYPACDARRKSAPENHTDGWLDDVCAASARFCG